MYLDFLVKIPDAPGKLVRHKKGNTVYIDYEYDRIYDKVKKYTIPRRSTIGKQSKTDTTLMQPNQNFLKFFPDAELPEEKNRSDRSNCIRVGSYIVIKKIMNDYGLPELLGRYFSEEELNLFLDLTAYSIISENNAAQHYPHYTYHHPLFTKDMQIYTDSTVSDFLDSIMDDQSESFLNSWNECQDHRQKIYISYDSSNKNCQAGDIEMVEHPHEKDDDGLPIFNYAVAYGTRHHDPLFYGKYPGNVHDVSQMQFMLDKALRYGYKKIGFILDRGYFSKDSINAMDRNGYDFVIMAKGKASFVNQLVLDNMGKFEKNQIYHIPEYGVYGITIKKKLYETDKRKRYFHIYHDNFKEYCERKSLESKIQQMTKFLQNHSNENRTFGSVFDKYFSLHYIGETFLLAEENVSTITHELSQCGYFVIVTSRKMTAREAINLYKSHDASEKLFCGDKSYMGDRSSWFGSDESTSAKIFMEFIALIVRNKIYVYLKEEMKKIGEKPNEMTVSAALSELEKIKMIRQPDQVYRLDHSITERQAGVLKAFNLNAAHIKCRLGEISKQLNAT